MPALKDETSFCSWRRKKQGALLSGCRTVPIPSDQWHPEPGSAGELYPC